MPGKWHGERYCFGTSPLATFHIFLDGISWSKFAKGRKIGTARSFFSNANMVHQWPQERLNGFFFSSSIQPCIYSPFSQSSVPSTRPTGEKKTKAFVKWRGGRSYIEFSNVSFCGGRRRIRFCVVCCMGVPVRFFSVIFLFEYSFTLLVICLGGKHQKSIMKRHKDFGTMPNFVHVISALLRIFVELHSASHGDSGNRPVPWTCDWRVPHYAKDSLLKGVFEAVPRALPLQRPHICKFVDI